MLRQKDSPAAVAPELAETGSICEETVSAATGTAEVAAPLAEAAGAADTAVETADLLLVEGVMPSAAAISPLCTSNGDGDTPLNATSCDRKVWVCVGVWLR